MPIDHEPAARSLRMVDELEQFATIDALTERYHAEFGHFPLNVYHWDSSDEFRAKMIPSLRLSPEPDPLSYIFSEALNCHDAVLRKLGFDPKSPRRNFDQLVVSRWK